MRLTSWDIFIIMMLCSSVFAEKEVKFNNTITDVNPNDPSNPFKNRIQESHENPIQPKQRVLWFPRIHPDGRRTRDWDFGKIHTLVTDSAKGSSYSNTSLCTAPPTLNVPEGQDPSLYGRHPWGFKRSRIFFCLDNYSIRLANFIGMKKLGGPADVYEPGQEVDGDDGIRIRCREIAYIAKAVDKSIHRERHYWENFNMDAEHNKWRNKLYMRWQYLEEINPQFVKNDEYQMIANSHWTEDERWYVTIGEEKEPCERKGDKDERWVVVEPDTVMGP